MLCCGDCPEPCRVFSSVPGLYTLDASSTLPAVTTKNVSRHCQMPLGVAKSSPIKNHWMACGFCGKHPGTNQRDSGHDATSLTASCLYFPVCLLGQWLQGKTAHCGKQFDLQRLIGVKVRSRHYVIGSTTPKPHVGFC